MNSQDHYPHPMELLRQLIRFDTTNPPGNEKESILFLERMLSRTGFDTTLLAREPERPNLIARLKGEGRAAPLLMYGHLDVVTTSGQQWRFPPFEGVCADECVWGRGALDMKGGIVMMVGALLRLIRQRQRAAGDIVLALVSDEEAGGNQGARFLVERHPEHFAGIRFAVGEFGGCSLPVETKRLYPIMVAEKQICWMRAVIRGPAGHGSLPMRGGAVARLGRMLRQLDKARLPVHIIPLVRDMVGVMAGMLPPLKRLLMKLLLRPALTDLVLELLGDKGRSFDPLLHNTVNATVLRGGETINVIPSEISVRLDGRLLPGFRPEDMLAELKKRLGNDVALELERYDACPDRPDMTLFPLLAGILEEMDPLAVPAPMLLPGTTDGRHFSKLGIQTYGFLPMKLPKDFPFFSLIHAADERIPVSALEFGMEAVHRLLVRYPG
ncbi:MAG: M20/M25/M40 family metallo-hydrolase [Thermodesulfobacteriota bacterium]